MSTTAPLKSREQAPSVRLWLPELSTALLTVLMYSRSLGFNFVFDDIAIIVQNITIHSWRYLPDYFTRDFWQNVQSGGAHGASSYYRPLVLLWFRINDLLFGVHPFGWHTTNLVLHIIAAVLVLHATLLLTKSRSAAWIAGLLFAVHPVHVETVSWISDAVDALLTVFYLAGLLCFAQWRQKESSAYLAGSLACYVGAMLSKEPGFTLPAVLFLYVLVIEDRPWKTRTADALRSVLWYVPFSILYLAARHHALREFSVSMQPVSAKSLLLTLPAVCWTYLRLLFVPFNLSPFYDLPLVQTANWQSFFAPLLGILAALALTVIIARKLEPRFKHVFWFAFGWCAVALAPALNLAAFSPSEMVHDRYLYLASVGFCLIAGLLLASLQPSTMTVLASSLVVLLGGVNIRQQGFWKDNLTLFARGVEVAPHNDNAESGLATLVARRGNFPLAISLYQDVLVRNPTQLNANLNLGWTYFLMGDNGNAEHFLTLAAANNVNSADPFLDLGVLYSKTGRPEMALASLRRAESLSAPRPAIHQEISKILEQQGDLTGAIREMQAAVEIAPQDPALRARLQQLQSK